MQKAKMAKLLTALILSAGILLGGQALAQIEGKTAAAPTQSQKNSRKITAYYNSLRAEVLAKLRPIERQEEIDFDAAEKALNTKTTNEKIFNRDFEKKMREEYSKKVSPFEETATDPVWRARYWEQQRYVDGRKNLASWTAREVLDDQLHDFINGGDQSSAPMKVLSTAHKLSGAEDREEPKMTEKEKIARMHRKDLPPLSEEEESIPTKLKTKINLIKTTGSLVFQNPVATTSLNGNKDDGVSVNMDKEFRKLTLKSNLNYGMKESVLNFNLNKKITDRISLDLDHASYTGSKRGSVGEKTREQAKLNYSLSF